MLCCMLCANVFRIGSVSLCACVERGKKKEKEISESCKHFQSNIL